MPIKKRSNAGKVKLRYGRMDLTDWELEALNKLRSGIDEIIKEAATVAFTNGEPGVFASFGGVWTDADGFGDGSTPDLPNKHFVAPLDIHIEVDGEDENPVFEFNLRNILADDIETCAQDGSFAEGLKRISEDLKALSAEIDAALVAQS